LNEAMVWPFRDGATAAVAGPQSVARGRREIARLNQLARAAGSAAVGRIIATAT